MNTIALSPATPRTRVLAILLSVGVLALASQLAIPLPGTPVPLTLQPLVVVLCGLLLGPRDGAVAMLAYLVLGATGLPVFAPIGAPGLARLAGPTGGYLIAYPVAAAIAGRIGAGKRLGMRLIGSAAGIAALYVFGLAQLTLISGSWKTAALLGLVPFIVADALKAVVAASLGGLRRPSL